MIRKAGLGAFALLLTGTAWATEAVAPDPTLPAVLGEAALAAGFTPDPFEVAVEAGGPIDLATVPDLAAIGCVGHVAAAPTYVIDYTPGEGVPLIIRALSGADLVLLISVPDGSWRCNDDSPINENPLIQWSEPPAGRYVVWVGTFRTVVVPGTLRISGRADTPE